MTYKGKTITFLLRLKNYLPINISAVFSIIVQLSYVIKIAAEPRSENRGFLCNGGSFIKQVEPWIG